jgi:hypothetical protein
MTRSMTCLPRGTTIQDALGHLRHLANGQPIAYSKALRLARFLARTYTQETIIVRAYAGDWLVDVALWWDDRPTSLLYGYRIDPTGSVRPI